MLDAVAEFIKAGREKTRRQGNSRPAQAAQGIADRRGRERDGGQRRMQSAEQDFQMIGVLVVIVMDSLPGACEKGHLEHSVDVQDIVMESILDEGIKEDGNDNGSYCGNGWSGFIE